MNVAWRIARRELRGGLTGFRVFLACLALGVAAIAAVGSVRESIEAGISEQGAVILGGDASVELTYRRASEADLAYLKSIADEVGEVIDFRSMATLPDGSDRALTQVKAVDGAWPIYGEAVLDPAIPLDQALGNQDGLPGAVLDPLLIDRLELSIGDTVRLGTQDFRVSAALVRAPDSAGGGFDFGPPTLVLTEALAGSGLISEGTLFDSEYRLRLPPGSDLAALKSATETAMEGSAPRWRDARDGAPGVSEFVDRLGSFLVLVGLAGLAVGGVGISAAVRAYLETKTEVIATLKTLGASRRTIMATYAIQIGVLTAIGLVAGLILGALIPLVAGPIITANLPIPADIAIRPGPLAEAALYGIIAAALFTLWPLARSENIRAAALFRDASLGAEGWPRPFWIVVTLALAALLVGTAALFSGMAEIALWSAFGIVVAFVLLVSAGRATRALSRRLARSGLARCKRQEQG